MKNILITLALCALLAGCSSTKIDHESCGGRILQWAFGPQQNEAFLDVCYADINTTAMDKVFVLTPLVGLNRETRQPIDPNNDGISGIGQKYRDRIRWGGANCQQYARRVVQKGCETLGNQGRIGGCDWIAFHIEPRPGVESGYVSFTPVWRVRQADGSEKNVAGRTFTTGFKNCGA